MINIHSNIWTAILVVLSSIMLAINYEIVEIAGVGLSFNFLSINDINVKKPEVFLVIVVAVILLASYFHLREFAFDFRARFVEEYRNSPELINHLQRFVAGIVGHNACGAPTAYINPGFSNKHINLGQFTQQNGRLSQVQIIKLPDSLHRSCFVLALKNCLCSRQSFFAITPIIIGFWSVAKIII